SVPPAPTGRVDVGSWTAPHSRPETTVHSLPPAATGPVEVPSGSWTAPPVRRQAAVTQKIVLPEWHGDGPPGETPTVPAEPAEPTDDLPPRKRRKVWRYVFIMGGLTVAAAAVVLAFVMLGHPEQSAADRADRAFTEKRYNDAAGDYAKLIAD